VVLQLDINKTDEKELGRQKKRFKRGFALYPFGALCSCIGFVKCSLYADFSNKTLHQKLCFISYWSFSSFKIL